MRPMTTERVLAEPMPPLDLVPVVVAQPLPVALEPPVRVAARAGRLHVAGVDPTTRAGRFLSIAVDGSAAGDAVAWPLRAAALAPLQDGLIATGSLPDDGPPLVFAVDDAGAIVWQHEVRVDQDQTLTRFPRPVLLADDGRVAVVWVTGERDPLLWIAEVAGDRLGPARMVPLAELTVDLDLDATAGAVTVARVRGYPLRLDLIRPGESPEPRPVDGARQVETVSIAVGGGLTVVAWTSMADDVVHAQAFGPGLAPLGEPAAVAEAPRPLRLRQARFVRGGDRLAIRFGASRAVAGWSAPRDASGQPGRRGRHERIEQFVAAYDPASGLTGAVQRVGEGGRGFDAAAWVDDRLLVIHGTDEPLLSTFAAQSGRTY